MKAPKYGDLNYGRDELLQPSYTQPITANDQYERTNADSIRMFKDTLLHLFNLTDNTVNGIMNELESTDEIISVIQRIKTLNLVSHTQLNNLINLNKHSYDVLSSAEDDLDDFNDFNDLDDFDDSDLANIYDQNLENDSDLESDEMNFDFGIPSVSSDDYDLESRMERGKVNERYGKLSKRILQELTTAQVDATLSAELDSDVDPADKRRIGASMATGNTEQIRQAKLKAYRSKQQTTNQTAGTEAETPGEKLIAQKKRELALLVQREKERKEREAAQQR